MLTRLTPQTALISVGVEQVVHPPSMQIAGEFHDQMRQWIEEFASFGRTSLNTVVLNSRRTAENISRQHRLVCRRARAGAAAEPAHRSQPAVIVSAGPSLRKNKHLLKGPEGPGGA